MASNSSHNGRRRSVRLADIAKQTGCSLATASKALNGRADVSEATRQAH